MHITKDVFSSRYFAYGGDSNDVCPCHFPSKKCEEKVASKCNDLRESISADTAEKLLAYFSL